MIPARQEAMAGKACCDLREQLWWSALEVAEGSNLGLSHSGVEIKTLDTLLSEAEIPASFEEPQ